MKRLWVVSLGIIVVIGLSAPPANATWGSYDINQCAINLENPHFSAGALGVITKSHWRCSDVTPTRHIYYVLYLWMCPMSNPQKDYLWLDDHCTIKGYNYDFDMPITSPAPDKVTRYAPPTNLPGAHGDGFWLAEAIWESYYTDPRGEIRSPTHVKFSAVVYIDA